MFSFLFILHPLEALKKPLYLLLNAFYERKIIDYIEHLIAKHVLYIKSKKLIQIHYSAPTKIGPFQILFTPNFKRIFSIAPNYAKLWKFPFPSFNKVARERGSQHENTTFCKNVALSYLNCMKNTQHASFFVVVILRLQIKIFDFAVITSYVFLQVIPLLHIIWLEL